MKILLTTRREHNEQRNPIAILDLAAYSRHFGHLVDCYYLDQIKGDKTRNRAYDVVGLSVLQTKKQNIPISDALYLKKRFHTEVVVGGKWTQTIAEEQKSYLLKNDIKVYTGAGERFFINCDIDYGEYPSWARVDFETLNDVRPDIMSTRGCPYHCHFCHNTERTLSFFSAHRTADNIELLFNLGLKRITFLDDIFTLKPSHMEHLYIELRKRDITIENRNEFFTHINHINRETIKWMKKYKPFRINIGIESGDDTMLNRMGKGFDAETALNKLKMLHDEVQVPIGASFIIGFPGETEESLKNTLDFAKALRPFASSWVSYFQPVRGTKGYEMAIERNGRTKLGGRNTSINYVDPNVTKKLLFKYNYKIMDYAQDNRLRNKLKYLSIQLLPYWVLAGIRLIRQSKRLRDAMNKQIFAD